MLAGKPMVQWVSEALRAGGLSDIVALGPSTVADSEAILTAVAPSAAVPTAIAPTAMAPSAVAPTAAVPTAIADEQPGAGPLAALVPALEQLGDLFVSPCDVPTLSAAIVEQILAVAASTPRPVVLAFSDRLEPLIGVYRAAAAPALRAALANGARGPRQVLTQAALAQDQPQALAQDRAFEYVTVGVDVAAVRNLNEPSDLAAAAAQLQQRATAPVANCARR